MATIDVFASREEAEQKLGRYTLGAHRKITKAIYAIADQKWLEHTVASGFNEKISSAPSPNSLPEDIYNKIYVGNGKGFEIHILVELYAHEDGFAYEFGTMYPPNRGCRGAYGRFLEEKERLRDLSALAQSVRQRISEDQDLFFGATINPVLYTVGGKQQQFIGTAWLDLLFISLPLPFIQREIYNRGLTKDEIEEFERLFNLR